MADDEDCGKLVSKLIHEVSQKPVLYDPQNAMYKDNHSRVRAWQQIAEKMEMPVTNCQIKWGTLRRCLANARKRQKRRQAIGSKYIKKWRYQDEMAFLLPFIDSRELDCSFTQHYRKSTSSSKPQITIDDTTDSHSHELYISEEYEQSSDIEDDSAELKPTVQSLQHYLIENAADQVEFQRYVEHETAKSSATFPKSPEDLCEEESLVMERSADSEREWETALHRQSSEGTLMAETTVSSTRSALSAYHVLDEMDTFFLSMSKTLKKLPRLDQIDVRSKVYEIVTQAELKRLKSQEITGTESKNIHVDLS